MAKMLDNRQARQLIEDHEDSLRRIKLEEGDPTFEPAEGAGVVPRQIWQSLPKKEARHGRRS